MSEESNPIDVRVYVAAPSRELGRAKALMAALRKAGATVVSTWPEIIEQQNALGRMHDSEVPQAELYTILRKDLVELAEAEVLVYVCGKSFGGHVELGYAISKGDATGGPYIIGVGEPVGFEILVDEQVADDAAAVAAVIAFTRLTGVDEAVA